MVDTSVGALDDELGARTIGNFGSLCYLVNQIFGPGVLAIPIVFVKSGLIPAGFVNLLVFLASCMASTMLMRAISLIPGNGQLNLHIEYAGAVKHYYGNTAAKVFQVLLHLSLQSLNIASIIVCAQSFDHILLTAYGHSFSLRFFEDAGVSGYQGGMRFAEESSAGLADIYDSADDQLILAITVGYVAVAVLCVPMGAYNIDDNIIVQVVSFLFLIFLMVEFMWQCTSDIVADTANVRHEMPALFGRSYTQLLSVFLFSYSFVMLVPPWANETKPSVSIDKQIWVSGFASMLGYFVIGLLLAWAYPKNATDDVLERMLAAVQTNHFTRICAYAFAATIILPGIPVFCITTRYDLYVSKVCGSKWALFWGNIAPWLVAWTMSSSQQFSAMLTWTSLVAGALVNFIIPIALYLKALGRVPARRASLQSPVARGSATSLSEGLLGAQRSAELSELAALGSGATHGHVLMTRLFLGAVTLTCSFVICFHVYLAASGHPL